VPSRTRPRRRRWAPQSGPCASWNGPYGRPGNRSSDHRSKLGRQASTVYARAVEIPAFDRMAEPEVATLAGRPKWAPPGRPKLGCVADSYVDRRTVAARCPGCGLLVRFWAEELVAQEDPSTREVLCAFCGNVTSLRRLIASTPGAGARNFQVAAPARRGRPRNGDDGADPSADTPPRLAEETAPLLPKNYL